MESISIELKRTSGNVHFEATSADHPAYPIAYDFVPPLGSEEGLSGLEALVMTFSGCVSTAVVALLLRLGRHVEEYTVHAEGERTEHPLSLRKIHFHVDLKCANVTADDMDWVFRQAQEISPVWIAIKGNVEVETSYQIQAD